MHEIDGTTKEIDKIFEEIKEIKHRKLKIVEKAGKTNTVPRRSISLPKYRNSLAPRENNSKKLKERYEQLGMMIVEREASKTKISNILGLIERNALESRTEARQIKKKSCFENFDVLSKLSNSRKSKCQYSTDSYSQWKVQMNNEMQELDNMFIVFKSNNKRLQQRG